MTSRERALGLETMRPFAEAGQRYLHENKEENPLYASYKDEETVWIQFTVGELRAIAHAYNKMK